MYKGVHSDPGDCHIRIQQLRGVVQELIAVDGLGAMWAQEWNGSVQCDKGSDEVENEWIEMQKGSGRPGNQPRKEKRGNEKMVRCGTS
jgi:hypothetical protein